MQPAISISSYLISLPLEFLNWWFVEATFNLFKILRFVLAAALRLLGVELLLKTFFKPWKNEYREGLTRFALFMGMGIKTFILFFDFLFFSALIFLEGLILVAWLAFPLLVIWGVYAAIFT
ncbi:MAG TPA: hypothetical protein VLE47_00440 [Candidatus Saccharimonadales bacterium]|nr:hypothetical protein [Candidatus Saccharimonadales bacterium]